MCLLGSGFDKEVFVDTVPHTVAPSRSAAVHVKVNPG